MLAERLAAESDAVAGAIEANDGCAAAAHASRLLAASDVGAVPDAVRREVERVADREFVCNPPPPPPPPPPATVTTDEAAEDDDEGQGRKKDKKKDKKGKKHGHEKGEDD